MRFPFNFENCGRGPGHEFDNSGPPAQDQEPRRLSLHFGRVDDLYLETAQLLLLAENSNELMIIINATITIHRHFLPLPSCSYRSFTVSECSIRAASELRPGNAKRNNHHALFAKLESCDYSEKRNWNQDTLNCR